MKARAMLRAAGGFLLFVALGLAALLGGGFFAVAAASRPRASAAAGAGGAVAGCALVLAGALASFAGGEGDPIRVGGALGTPGIDLAMDGLSAFFLLPLGAVGMAAALFAVPYFRGHGGAREKGPAWFQFNALLASMVVVVTSANGLAFLIAWESVAVLSFLLVLFDGEDAKVRGAAWTYLVASQLGTAAVLGFFALAGASKGTLDFGALAAPSSRDDVRGLALFALAAVGFGTKAGLLPLHVWLPEAHPAAPAPVSALMSGAMVNLGIYGLLRGLTFAGAPALSWGWALLLVGGTSGVVGALYALAQRDLKRALAYSTIENMGVAALAVSVGIIGAAAGAPAVSALGFAGALLHVLNHSAAKSLLFLAAGALSEAAHTVDLDRLGGAMRRMPRTGAAALVGSASLAGLPPLGGFAGEFLALFGAVGGAATLGPSAALPLAIAAGMLALASALGAAALIRVCGAAFLGEPRSRPASEAREGSALIVAPLLGLAFVSAALGALAPALLSVVGPAVAPLLPAVGGGADAFGSAREALLGALQVSAVLVGAALALSGIRRALESRSPRATGPTWDCGFAAPDARMEYTASSFSAPLSAYFGRMAPRRVAFDAPEGPFPRRASLADEAPDVWMERGFAPAFLGARRVLVVVLRLQNGRIQAYVLYIVAALLALLLWRLL